ncbi:hypothetical protein BH11PSE11_BH11PSE11_22630 [soil metagenome]
MKTFEHTFHESLLLQAVMLLTVLLTACDQQGSAEYFAMKRRRQT